MKGATLAHRLVSEPRDCVTCSQPLVGRFQVKYCSLYCSRKARATTGPRPRGKRAEAVIEDVQWIIGTDAPQSIAKRVGYASLSSLTRSLEHWGEVDLAHRLDTENRGEDWFPR